MNKKIFLITCFYFLIIFLLLLDTAVYPGCVKKYFFVYPWFLALSFLSYMIYFRFKNKKKIIPIYKINNFVVLPVSFLITVLSLYLESTNYPNYVFEHFHLHYDVLAQIFFFSILVSAVTIKKINYLIIKRLIFLTPLALFLVGLIMNFWPFDFFIVLNKEDGVIEYLQTFLYFFASALVFISAIKTWKNKKLFAIFLIVYTGALFFIAGEEISWGQRLLKFDTPEELKEVNYQDEFTLHNIDTFAAYIWQTYVLLGIYGSVSWLVRILINKVNLKFFNKIEFWLNYILPQWQFSLYFFSIFAYNFYQKTFDFKVPQFSEYSELILALGIFLMVTTNYLKDQRDPSFSHH